MKFLIVEPSPLPIIIPLGPKYSPQDPVFKYPIIIIIIIHLDVEHGRYNRKSVMHALLNLRVS